MRLIHQLDETDCGAACIAMIAAHFGLKKGITSIREVAGTDRQGTNLAGLVKAAKELGFNARAMKGDGDSFITSLPVPFIAHTKEITEYGEILHFVVVARVGKDRILVLDPGKGKIRYARKIFLMLRLFHLPYVQRLASYKTLV